MKTLQQTKHSLGSEALLTLVTTSPEPDRHFLALWEQIDTFEASFSRFLSASELSAFNRAAGLKTAISPPFQKLLVATKQAALRSNGLFNPFILPALQRAGYQASWSNRKLRGDDHTSGLITNIADLEIGAGWARIPEHTALDLGGIGKGYLLDQLADSLPAAVAGFWFSLGGDIIAGGASPNGQGWQIAVASASHPTQDAATMRIPAGQTLAVATSGVTKRHGNGPAGPWHHLIDPRTGRPSDTDVLTATVAAATATEADVAAGSLVIAASQSEGIPTDAYIQYVPPKPPLILGSRITQLALT